MLRTNGNSTNRETYSNDVGSLIIIPSRNPADRTLLGYAEFSITYRFAGVHKPNIAVPRPISTEPDDRDERISQLTALLDGMGVCVTPTAKPPKQVKGS